MRLVVLCVLILAAAVVPVVAGGRPRPVEHSSMLLANPVLAGDWPDPTVLRVGNAYWAATTATTGIAMPLLTSTDLVHWRATGGVLAAPPRWATPDTFWAPALTRVGGRFVVYYATRRADQRLCLAVATADTVSGPYADAGPLTCQPDGSIDPDQALDEHGAPWLIWKEDGNSAAHPTRIWARRLTPDGLHLTGPKRLLMSNSQPWDGGIVEGPEVVHHDGWFYLFYSGGGCCSLRCTYALGVARSRSLLGPWVQDRRNPILPGNSSWRCPGHATFTQDAAGQWFALYHAVAAKARVFARSLLLDRLEWSGGWPSIDGGRGPSLQVQVPGLAGQPVGR